MLFEPKARTLQKGSGLLLVMLTVTMTTSVFDAGAQTKAAGTVLDGVYTESQAQRGEAAYAANCARCHGANLESFSGPPLKGNLFMDRWREFDLSVLFDLIQGSMPKDQPSSLAETQYLDIASHILRANGIPSGSKELTKTVVQTILLVGKDGPKPLPNSAQVNVVGCLKEDSGNGFFLVSATEPARTLDMWETKEAEVQAAKQTTLGSLVFRLENLRDLPGFNPANFIGHKMEAKGILVHQVGNERINVTLINNLVSVCDQ
jgi:cbb3-type cytochrome c oxidase subunit III